MVDVFTIVNVEANAIDKLVGELLHEPFIIGDNLPIKNETSGKYKVYYYKSRPIKIVNHGLEYDYEDKNTMAKEEDYNLVDRITLPVHISGEHLKSSRTEGITDLLAMMEIESRKQLHDDIDETIIHGNLKAGNSGMTNFTGVTTNPAAAVWTTAGNFAADLETAISALRSANVLPPYDLWATPGIHSELRGNFIANIGNEFVKGFKEVYQNFSDARENPPIIKKVVWTDKIVNAALSTVNQGFILFKNDPRYLYVGQVDGIHREDTPTKRFASDLEYAIRWAGTFIPKNPDAVAVCTGGTTGTAY